MIARAAAALGLDLADLASAEAAGLVSLGDGVVEFRHPLARAASYGDASLAQRREAHRALAGALPDRDGDRRAWHLASAATGPDAAVSAALQQAAERARGRSAYATASAAFERAARLAEADGLQDQCCTPQPMPRGEPAPGSVRSARRRAAVNPRPQRAVSS